MLRWGLLLVKVKRPALAEAPHRVTRAEAAALVAQPGRHYVELTAQPDLHRRIYATGIQRPLYTSRAPTENRTLEPSDAESGHWDDLLGTLVTLRAPLDTPQLSLQTVVEQEPKNKVLSERLLAPLQGTNQRVWVLSALFHGDGAVSFATAGHYQGRLTLLDDLDQNNQHPPLRHEVADIREFLQEKTGRSLPAHAYLILTAPGPPANHWYCPLAESQNLFVLLNGEAERSLSGTMRGILESAESSLYRDFERLLGAPLPPRIGILTSQTAATYHQRNSATISDLLMLGSIATALGAVLIGIRRRHR